MTNENSWLGFELRLIDRVMCLRHAELIGAAIAAFVSSVTLMIFCGIDFSVSHLLNVLRTHILIFIFFGVIFASGGWWTVHTWTQLWRQGRGRWERIVYDYGVRLVGYFMSVSVFFILAWAGWISDSKQWFGPLMMGGIISALFFGVPVTLYMGYVWGYTFAAIVGAQRDSRVEVGHPPHLK